MISFREGPLVANSPSCHTLTQTSTVILSWVEGAFIAFTLSDTFPRYKLLD